MIWHKEEDGVCGAFQNGCDNHLNQPTIVMSMVMELDDCIALLNGMVDGKSMMRAVDRMR